MNTPQPFVIGSGSACTPGIADLVCMMRYARFTTLKAVENLSTAQLDYLHDAQSNSIGSLLLHMSAVETYYSTLTFEGREMSEDELKPLQAALDLGDLGRKEIRGNDLDYYIQSLDRVRQKTLAEFARRDDAWLRKEVPFWGGLPGNHYFMWFHVFEDEVNHRGQIRWLRKRLPDLLNSL